MKIHFTSAVTIAVTLLFISGTIGCQSNGGAWYNPKTYTWSNPFSKKNEAPSYSAATSANPKPSFDSSPNIEEPRGGYTEETNAYASRAGSQSGSSNGFPLDQGRTPTPAPQGTTNPYSSGGGYSVAETSSYPPPYAGSQPQGAEGTTQNQYHYPSSGQYSQATNTAVAETPLGSSPYANNNYAVGAQYPSPNVTNYPPATSNDAMANPYGGATQTGTSVATNSTATTGNYAPFTATSQQDPYATQVQQTAVHPTQATVPASGYYDQSVGLQPATAPQNNGGYYNQPSPSPYTQETAPTAAPSQPFPAAPPATGYGY